MPKIVYLNDAAVAAIEDWLETRSDDYDELFLTNRSVPYARPKKNSGGQLKTGFNAARRRAAEIMAKDPKDGGWDDRERAAVMQAVTPHWGRHNLTSPLLAEGQSKESIKNDLGWSSIEMVERHGHDLPGLGKARANLVQFGSDTKLTHTKKKKAKK